LDFKANTKNEFTSSQFERTQSFTKKKRMGAGEGAKHRNMHSVLESTLEITIYGVKGAK